MKKLFSIVGILCVLCGCILPAAAANPGGITTAPKLWLDATAGVYKDAGTTLAADGETIQQWNDQSGQGNHAAQATAGQRPTYKTNVINGKPAIRFTSGSATNVLLPAGFDSAFSSAEIFIVLRINNDPPGADVSSGLWTLGSGGGLATHFPYTDGIIYETFGTTVRKVTGDPTALLTGLSVYNVSSAPNAFTSRINNVQHFTTATNTVGWDGTPRIGCDGSGAYRLDGDVAEVVMYDTVLSGADRSAVYSYLSGKWNTPPAGKVEFLASVIGSGAFGGDEASYGKANAFDRDFATAFVPSDGNGYAGMDTVAPATVTDISLSARAEIYGDPNQVSNGSQTWVLKVGTTSPTAGLTTAASYTSFTNRWIYRNRRNRIAVTTPTSGRYHRIDFAGNAGPGMGEIILIGPGASGVNSRPVLPTISPCGGKYGGARPPVTLASETTSAAIYYTLDGSAPSAASTRYNGPFVVTPSGGGLTLKAIAIDAGCSTPSSEVATGIFYDYSTRPRDPWRDTSNGLLLDYHGGGMLVSALGKYWLYGFSVDRTNSGSSEVGSGVHIYSSGDLWNWSWEGQACGPLTALGSSNQIQRPHVIYNPATSKYVMWCLAGILYPPNAGQVLTADDPRGPWTAVTSNISPNGHGMADQTLFVDDDGAAYWVYVPTSKDGIYFTRLNAAWTDVTATEVKVPWPGNREAPIAIKRRGNYFLITSVGNFYDDTSSTDEKFIVGTGASTPIAATWNVAGAASIYASDPFGTSNHNQSAHAFKVPGRDGSVYMGDDWSGPADVHDLIGSRQVWLPLTFPTDTTLRVTTPASWSINDFHAELGRSPVSIGVGLEN
jgi:hypothetical protein